MGFCRCFVSLSFRFQHRILEFSLRFKVCGFILCSLTFTVLGATFSVIESFRPFLAQGFRVVQFSIQKARP